jgi:hypothetical protein
MSRREDQGDERGAEEHLDDGDAPIVTAKDFREGISVIDTKALGCAYSQAAMVLVEGDEVEGGVRVRHGSRAGVQAASLVVVLAVRSSEGNCHDIAGKEAVAQFPVGIWQTTTSRAFQAEICVR